MLFDLDKVLTEVASLSTKVPVPRLVVSLVIGSKRESSRTELKAEEPLKYAIPTMLFRGTPKAIPLLRH